MEWPIKKIPLRRTGRRTGYGIEYHAEMQVYALATSISVEFILRDENGDPINDVEQGKHIKWGHIFNMITDRRFVNR